MKPLLGSIAHGINLISDAAGASKSNMAEAAVGNTTALYIEIICICINIYDIWGGICM
jgi:hypothetical protein